MMLSLTSCAAIDIANAGLDVLILVGSASHSEKPSKGEDHHAKHP